MRIFSKVTKRMAKRAGALSAAAMLFVSGFAGCGEDPKKAVEKAAEVMEEAAVPSYEEVFGLDALSKAVEKTGMELGVNVKLEDISGDDFGFEGMTIPNVGIELIGRNDVKNDLFDGSLNLKVADTSLMSGKVYADKKTVEVAVPELFQSILTLNYGDEKFLENLKNSYLVELAGISKENLTELFAELPTGTDYAEMITEYQELAVEIAEAAKLMEEGTEYTAAEKQELEIDGETVKVKVYNQTVSDEAFHKMLDTVYQIVMDYMKELYKEMGMEEDATWSELEQYRSELTKLSGLQITHYISGKRIVRQDIGMQIDGGTFHMKAYCAPKGNPYENMTADVTFSMPEQETITISMVLATENTEDIYSAKCDMLMEGAEIAYGFVYEKLDGDFSVYMKDEASSVDLELTGAFGELEKGKKIGVELDTLSVKAEDVTEKIELNTSMYVKVFDSTISPLEGSKTDMLTMKQTDVEKLVEEITMSVYQLAFSLMGLFE